MSLEGAARVLCLGIGGGGDVVGALGTALHLRRLGTEAIVGGITWERRPIDPIPGPRRMDEVGAARRLNDVVALAGAETYGPGDVLFAESHMAAHLGEPTVLVDPNPGAAAVARGLADAAEQLRCDALALVDVGGDVLAHGDEEGLASPLADSVMLAAARHLEGSGLKVTAAVFGAGCDGELKPTEVLERIAEVARGGGWLATHGLGAGDADALEAAIERVPTEASAMAVRCARGGYGTTTIRQGRRTVELSPVGALTFHLDPLVAMDTAARLADAVADAPSLREANAILHRLGVRSELDYELDAAQPG